MSRLGLETLDEYFEYLDFQERLQKRRDKSKDMEMKKLKLYVKTFL